MIPNVMAFKAPYYNYALFVMEWYLMVKIQAVQHGFSYEFVDFLDFITIFHKKNEHIEYILCELYMHNFMLTKQRDENLVPFF